MTKTYDKNSNALVNRVAYSVPHDVNTVPAMYDPILDVPHVSRDGYEFNPRDDVWKLNKNEPVYLIQLKKLISLELLDKFLVNLIFYAEKRSSGYTGGIVSSCVRYFRYAKTSQFDFTSIVN